MVTGVFHRLRRGITYTHFLHCSILLPLSPCSGSYANFCNNEQGNSEHIPQCISDLSSQHFFTGQMSPQNGFDILTQPLQSTLSLYKQSVHTIPHRDSTIHPHFSIFIDTYQHVVYYTTIRSDLQGNIFYRTKLSFPA